MNNYLFWNAWKQPYKGIASLLFWLLVGLISVTLVLLAIGSEGLIGWHTFSQRFAVDVVSQVVDVGPFSFPSAYFLNSFLADRQFGIFLE